MNRKQTSIGRRLEQSLNSLIEHDYESSLVHFFPALDKTAKIRRPKSGVGERMKGFLRDEEEFISFLAFRWVMKGNTFDGLGFAEAIYKFGRTSIMHEGELDSRLTFENTDSLISIGQTWKLSPAYIAAMITAVMAAKENECEFFTNSKVLNLHGHKFNANDVWGKKSTIQVLLKMPVRF
ncbi:hypothetical protein [Pantoea anthophila]|uniref:hypothetical protein n=1 Tax=Pantoea anthophila TaxID=470931 RepID=UPI00301B37A2